MNIFASSECPIQSALWLDDKRKNKMILESCQIMSSVVRRHDPDTTLMVYHQTHIHHPCTIWAGDSRANFLWLYRHCGALILQKFGPHKSARLMPIFKQYIEDGLFPCETATPFSNSARNQSVGVDYSHVEDVHYAYKLYLNERWYNDKRQPTWSWGEKPWWFVYNWTPKLLEKHGEKIL